MKNALLLVDLQIDFLPGGALPVAQGNEVIPIANALQPYFDLIVATQDWHPANHRSFASQHAAKKNGDVIDLDGLPQVLWPDHCVQGSVGASFAPALETCSIACVFQKGVDPRIDSYSGFFDNGHRRATGLGEYLQERRIHDVFVLGLATDYCVRATALDAVQLGFRTYLVEDACRGVELQPGDIERSLCEMQEAGVTRVDSRRWLDPLHYTEQTGQAEATPFQSLARGKYLEFVSQRDWEFVRRTNAPAVVVIVAITDHGEVVLVEQFREPLGRRSIELPAGLVGDVVGCENEELEIAVRRELLEETGFEAARIEWLGQASTSSGLTSEAVDVLLATGLRRSSAGAGDGDERIVVHCVPWPELPVWLSRSAGQGYCIAMSLYGGLWLAEKRSVFRP